MSRETAEWLNRNVLIGNTSQRGKAWHYRASAQGAEPNHYDGPIPVADVQRRLFDWRAIELPVTVTVPAGRVVCDIVEADGIGDDGMPFKMGADVTRPIPNTKAICASDTGDVLGIFKDGYQPHQYSEWLLDTVATILDDDLSVSSAGLLRNRAVAWVEVSVPESIQGPAGVVFRPNLLATTSFDGSIATTYKRTVTDVVCDNTRTMALSENGETYRVKHTRYSGHKIVTAREALAVVHTVADDFAAEIERLVNWKITDLQLKTVIDTLVPLDNGMSGNAQTRAQNKRGDLWRLARFDERCAPWLGTAYGVVQTFNTWEHHNKGVKGQTRVERNMLATIKGEFEKSDGEVLAVLAGV